MTVLIAKKDAHIIEEILSKVKFYEQNKYQYTFNITEKKFESLYQQLMVMSYNPFALMYWQ